MIWDIHRNSNQTRTFKHEIRISKHETNYNDRMTKILNKKEGIKWHHYFDGPIKMQLRFYEYTKGKSGVLVIRFLNFELALRLRSGRCLRHELGPNVAIRTVSDFGIRISNFILPGE